MDKSPVNREARRHRHYKLFCRYQTGIFLKICTKLNLFLKGKALPRICFSKKSLSSQLNPDIDLVIHNRLIFKRCVAILMFFFVINSLNVNAAYSFAEENPEFWGFEEPEIEESYLAGLINDEEGYLQKTLPAGGEDTKYLNRNEIVVMHEVQENQTLSQIALMYGLEVRTLLWANNITNPNRLSIGNKLKIPKTNGVLYNVAVGETIDKIASKYQIDAKKIRETNGVQNDIIRIGQTLILPDAKPIVIIKESPKIIAKAKAKSPPAGGSKSAFGKKTPPPSQAKISGGGKMTFPTTGNVTQGYHRGHLALDIGNRSKPGVWAARAGTVVKTQTGWGGGYGNHIIVDHGGGVQTLYAHLSEIYVSEGQEVNEGQVIGRMGNSGRVYGFTGIHLHFEVRINGAKVSPWNYL